MYSQFDANVICCIQLYNLPTYCMSWSQSHRAQSASLENNLCWL